MKIQNKNENMASPKAFNFTQKQEEQQIAKNTDYDSKPENAL